MSKSGHCLNLLNRWHEMQQAGVQAMRLSAHSEGVFGLASQLRSQLQGEESLELLAVNSMATQECNGYWLG